MQGCTNTGRQFGMGTKCCVLLSNICESSVWNSLHVIILAHTIDR